MHRIAWERAANFTHSLKGCRIGIVWTEFGSCNSWHGGLKMAGQNSHWASRKATNLEKCGSGLEYELAGPKLDIEMCLSVKLHSNSRLDSFCFS